MDTKQKRTIVLNVKLFSHQQKNENSFLENRQKIFLLYKIYNQGYGMIL